MASIRMPFVIGVDLGQSRDPSAISVLERVEKSPWHDPSQVTELLHVRHLERLPLNTPYPQVVRTVVRLTNRIPAELVVDASGVGRPVVDALRESGLTVVAITITGGETASGGRVRGGEHWRVAKRELVGALTTLLHSERLHIAAALPLASTLVEELLSFETKVTASARETYSAREGAHDDLVLATAIAAWHAMRKRQKAGWRQIDLQQFRDRR